MPLTRCPFSRENALVHRSAYEGFDDRHDSSFVREVPGWPLISWDDRHRVISKLEDELVTTDLDTMAPYMWLMATQSSANISALHHQIVKDRKIIVTEDPQLHLVWLQDRIYIKPMPHFLLSYNLWDEVLLSPTADKGAYQVQIVKAALGYLRSYCYLVQHESDLHIAQRDDLRLVPSDATWEQVSRFLADVGSVRDHEVSPRYVFGELRLSRLNFYGKFILRRFHYVQLHVQYGSYFAQFYTPLLFFFGLFALALNAMQVELAFNSLADSAVGKLQDFGHVLALLSLAWLALITSALLLLFLYRFIDEWQYAIRDRLRRGRINES